MSDITRVYGGERIQKVVKLKVWANISQQNTEEIKNIL